MFKLKTIMVCYNHNWTELHGYHVLQSNKDCHYYCVYSHMHLKIAVCLPSSSDSISARAFANISGHLMCEFPGWINRCFFTEMVVFLTASNFEVVRGANSIIKHIIVAAFVTSGLLGKTFWAKLNISDISVFCCSSAVKRNVMSCFV